ncbi:MAG: hypothetical protein HQ518_11465 [Rhodopirellula sp.]|nr:hypothetical protein [Rhodopirellula sp.]
MQRHVIAMLLALILCGFASKTRAELKLATFEVDATPPVGTTLAYDPAIGVQTPLSCRGVVLTGAGQPIVLCAVDWIGIGTGGQIVFKESFAKAAATIPQRVVVHTLHQHDAPRCDFAVEELLRDHGLENSGFDDAFGRDVVHRASIAIRHAIKQARPVTHLGLGIGIVQEVASNRRILGEDGKVKFTRWTATRDPELRAFPVGTIDPQLKMVSFWNGDEPLVALSYYACHPQSYYRTGMSNPDFPGLARNARQSESHFPHIHFNGAGGNIGAGKWNDGSKENRQVLADKVAAGMKQAWEATEKSPLKASDVAWSFEPVSLPVAAHLDESALLKTVQNKEATPTDRWFAAKHLIWLRRCNQQETIDISCLSLNDCRLLHLPGELFVEYQLAAQKLRPELFVAMAAYGDYSPGYIGTEIAYSQGGYETSARASRVAPSVEGVLMDAVSKLLGAP